MGTIRRDGEKEIRAPGGKRNNSERWQWEIRATVENRNNKRDRRRPGERNNWERRGSRR